MDLLLRHLEDRLQSYYSELQFLLQIANSDGLLFFIVLTFFDINEILTRMRSRVLTLNYLF